MGPQLFWGLFLLQNNEFKQKRRILTMTNKNDNRESKNKYPNNKNQDTEFNKDIHIRSEITKKDLQNKSK
ncbi:hypothetical protein B1NLA3E_10105 [Bacillus sp. 1NLA3E]|nr:hypothetical protein B1NLA3E_10105 [Bacillus sp. 1NLA3E]